MSHSHTRALRTKMEYPLLQNIINTNISYIVFGDGIVVDDMIVTPCIVRKPNSERFISYVDSWYTYDNYSIDIGKVNTDDLIIEYCLALKYEECIPFTKSQYKEIAIKQSHTYMERVILDKVSRIHGRMNKIAFLKDILSYQVTIGNGIRATYDNLVDEEIQFRILSSYAKKIQRRFRLAIADPSCQLCTNRLWHEFYDLIESL